MTLQSAAVNRIVTTLHGYHKMGKSKIRASKLVYTFLFLPINVVIFMAVLVRLATKSCMKKQGKSLLTHII